MPIQRKKEEHFMNTGIYIPSIDARDIFLSSHRMGEPRGEYSLKLTDGQYDLQKFNSTLDCSLDSLELSDIYYKSGTRKMKAYSWKPNCNIRCRERPKPSRPARS